MNYLALSEPLDEILEALRKRDKRLYSIIATDQKRLGTVARLVEELKRLSEAL